MRSPLTAWNAMRKPANPRDEPAAYRGRYERPDLRSFKTERCAGAVDQIASQPCIRGLRFRTNACRVPRGFSRAKFSHLHPDVFPSMLALIERRAARFTPDRQLTISSHDSDNRFYECADAASADYIVTGNLKHFSKPYKNTKIITTRELLQLLEDLSG